jgi:hypothetical protein
MWFIYMINYPVSHETIISLSVYVLHPKYLQVDVTITEKLSCKELGSQKDP